MKYESYNVRDVAPREAATQRGHTVSLGHLPVVKFMNVTKVQKVLFRKYLFRIANCETTVL